MSEKPFEGKVTETFIWPFVLSDGEKMVWSNLTGRMKEYLSERLERLQSANLVMIEGLTTISVANSPEFMKGIAHENLIKVAEIFADGEMSTAEKAEHFDAILEIISVDSFDETIMHNVFEYCNENKIDYKQ